MQVKVEPRGATSPDRSRFPQPGDALETLRQARMRGVPVALLSVSLTDRGPSGEDCAALGRRLRAIVRASDPVFSLGITGYAVLLAGVGPAAAAKVATRLATALGTPVEVVARSRGELPEATLLRLGAELTPVTPAAPHPPQRQLKR